MRWLFHIRIKGDASQPVHDAGSYCPASLSREGFVHASFRDDVFESARLHFAGSPADALEVLQIDPRRLGVSVEVAETPRGSMPHIMGPIARDAIAAVHPLSLFDPARPVAVRDVPDAVRGTR